MKFDKIVIQVPHNKSAEYADIIKSLLKTVEDNSESKKRESVDAEYLLQYIESLRSAYLKQLEKLRSLYEPEIEFALELLKDQLASE